MTYKAMYKYELASAAGVSTDTFRRWLISDRDALEAMGVSSTQHLLPPGTGLREFAKLSVHNQEEYAAIQAAREAAEAALNGDDE